jgi:uncharacterized protein
MILSGWMKFVVCSLCMMAIGQQGLAADKPYVVFVTGDEEYRSEESMPMLAEILERNYGWKTKVCYAIDPADGTINPSYKENIAGLEALKEADLMVVYTRFRKLPAAQLQMIIDYTNSGKPLAGFRTTTHAVLYDEGPLAKWNDGLGRDVFGQKWITHHGHHGHQHLTDVELMAGQESHPVLRGVGPFKAYSWLYHVDGGNHKLSPVDALLLKGTSLVSSHQMAGKLEEFPLVQPVAWTRTYTGETGKSSRVFFTTLGEPWDFESESMRRLAINGFFWALGKEGEIPAAGTKVDVKEPFEISKSGFGTHVPGKLPPK